MTTANEAASGRTPLGSALKAGLDVLSLDQTITFDLYVRLVLPLDGFVFWVRSTAVNPAILATVFRSNTNPVPPANQIKVMGSLHYATEIQQITASSIAVNRVVFSSQEPVQDFSATGQNAIYIATFDGVRFAFSQRQSWYQQANLWHLIGHAVYSTMESQIIEDPNDPALDPTHLIVSNSLPAWLATNTRTIPWLPYWETPRLTLFPSFLVDLNLPPIYGAVHIVPDRTEAVQSVPLLDARYNRQQLAKDKVEITLYGADNQLASDFADMIIDYMDTEAPMGLINMGAIQDRKKVQPERLILAQEKTIEFEVSYNQSAMRDLARQLILEATCEVIPDPHA